MGTLWVAVSSLPTLRGPGGCRVHLSAAAAILRTCGRCAFLPSVQPSGALVDHPPPRDRGSTPRRARGRGSLAVLQSPCSAQPRPLLTPRRDEPTVHPGQSLQPLTTTAAVCSLVACGSNLIRPEVGPIPPTSGRFSFQRGRRQPLPPPVTPPPPRRPHRPPPPPPTGASAREISPGLGAATVVDYAHPPPSAATRVLIYSATHSLPFPFHSRPRQKLPARL